MVLSLVVVIDNTSVQTINLTSKFISLFLSHSSVSFGWFSRDVWIVYHKRLFSEHLAVTLIHSTAS